MDVKKRIHDASVKFNVYGNRVVNDLAAHKVAYDKEAEESFWLAREILLDVDDNFHICMMEQIRNGLRDSLLETIKENLEQATHDNSFEEAKMCAELGGTTVDAKLVSDLLKVHSDLGTPVNIVIAEILEAAVGTVLSNEERKNIPDYFGQDH